MQITRLFHILYILLNQKTITAKELAEQFEVSVRTIYRDIDILSQSGIPIYTSKGKGGGIGILSNFVLNKSLLLKEEQEEIISALQGLNATRYADDKGLIMKLSQIFGTSQTNWIEVDYSDWGDGNKAIFLTAKEAILQKKVLEFDYYNRNSEKLSRSIEPLQLWFKNKTWYLWGYCRVKSDYRLFKLNRIKNMKITRETFTRTIPANTENLAKGFITDNAVKITLKINHSMAYRVYDEFDPESITEEEGNFLVEYSCPEDEWLYGYILSFGKSAEVIEPPHIREIIKNYMTEVLNKYK